ncbi:DoxX family protein [Dactylosporangium sp. CA-092794]|uniref:DoxX family protein n=1 Tax=Dactylosporangium sp. CA-092794 TaxID=3239929 RepID=UPI003D913817
MNIALWVVAGLVAAGFLFSGVFKLVLPREKYVAAQPWAADAPLWAPTVIGVLEVLGAVGVILPAAIGVVPVLVPVAAAGLVLVMVGAVVMHLRRGEFPALAPSGVLLILAAVVAWGRFGPYAF